MEGQEGTGTERKIIRGDVDRSSKGQLYDGVYYSFTLKSPVDIGIYKLEFFGPHRDVGPITGCSEYEVFVEIKKHIFLDNKESDIIYLPNTRFYINAQNSMNFGVEFPFNVVVPAGQWIQIRFKLEGPKTFHMLQGQQNQTVLFDNRSEIRFDCLCGSKQLARIYFQPALAYIHQPEEEGSISGTYRRRGNDNRLLSVLCKCPIL